MNWLTRLFLDEQLRLRGACRAFVFLVLCSLFGFLLRFPASVLQFLLNRDASSFDFRLGLLSTCLGSIFVTWICCSMEGVRFRSVGFQFSFQWFRQFLAGCLGGLAIIVVTAGLLWALGGVRWTWTPDVLLKGLPMGIPFFLLVALHEEVVYRGYAFQRLGGDLGSWQSLAVMTLLFVLAHWGNPGMIGSMRLIASLNIGLAGLLLGLAYQRTESLALPIGIHLGWNWAQGSLLGFGVSGTGFAHGLWSPTLAAKPAWITGGAFGLEGSLLCAPVCALAIALLFLKKKAPTPSEA